MLVDYPHGKGRIVIMSDPYIVANGGISAADNLILAMNVIAGGQGLIAFDEHHQGRTTTQNEFVAYFKGTPLLAMLAQFGLIVVAILWTQGRRFARPLPIKHEDRRSSLEFVASMAELHQRARAFDLGIENIYLRIRRAMIRYAGLNASSSRTEIARAIALRTDLEQQKVEELMRDCEDTINGQPVDARRALQLVRSLRELEKALGLARRSRDIL
jgi:hypothetical protein